MTLVELSHPTGERQGPATSLAVGELGGARPGRLADLPTVVVDVGWRAIGPEAFVHSGDLAGTAVLLSTGWDRHWGTEHYGGPTHPFLTEAGAHHLVQAGVVLVGIDSVDIDDTADTAGTADTADAGAVARPTRAALLAGGVAVVVHLTGLDALPETGALLTAEAAGSAVRAFAVVG